ncbi:MAG: xanthine dehydrogenase accessory protein XdhC [Hyphomicrobiales bacterium]
MSFWTDERDMLERGEPLALVRVAEVQGSAPREAGAVMAVTSRGILGTVGGGTLEWRACAAAQKLLQAGRGSVSRSYALGPELGQCCGGRVRLETRVYAREDLPQFDMAAEAAQAVKRQILLFGAGHVGRALVFMLAQNEFPVLWTDPRPGALPALLPESVTAGPATEPISALAQAPEGAIAMVMTHSHDLDLRIVDAALRQPRIARVGLIGSATKKGRFLSRLREAGVSEADIGKLICPIGLGGISSKKPAAIAVSVAAQILQLDESLPAVETCPQKNKGRAAS